MSIDLRQNADTRAGFTEEEIAEGETLLGWFDPLELPSNWSGDVVDAGAMLHRLVVYKRPLEEEYPERKRFLTEIRKTTTRTRSTTTSTICFRVVGAATVRANCSWRCRPLTNNSLRHKLSNGLSSAPRWLYVA